MRVIVRQNREIETELIKKETTLKVENKKRGPVSQRDTSDSNNPKSQTTISTGQMKKEEQQT